MSEQEILYPGQVFNAFGRLATLAPYNMNLKDLAKATVSQTGENTPFKILQRLKCEVRHGPCGGDWLIIPISRAYDKNNRWSVVVDPKRCEDIEIAYCQCITAILFNLFNRLSGRVEPNDEVKEKREKLYSAFTYELLEAIKEG